MAHEAPGEPFILYIDLHLVHEVTSPQAFDGLRMAGRGVRRPDLTLATIDHGVPTANRNLGIRDPLSKRQIDALIRNCEEYGITLYGLDDPRQGIVHIIGPEQGLTQPGMTIVCGDSHTATHGAFGALAFGIGTSEVEHVLATQTLPQIKPKAMAVTVEGDLPRGVAAKDIILAIIARIGVAGGTGHVIEYRGSTIRSLSMAGRMTICNMSIEGGARAGMVGPDDTTYSYIEGRPHAPEAWEQALDHWRTLPTDQGATFDSEVEVDARSLEPHVSWGTNPAQTAPVSSRVPHPDDYDDPLDREGCNRALGLHGPGGRSADHRHPAGPRVPRVLYERPHRGPPGRGRRGRRPQGGQARAGDGGTRFRTREAPSRGRGPGPDLQGGRVRMARRGLLHVPGDERRHPGTRRAVRVDIEP